MSIEVTGIPAGYATPGDFLQISFGVGPSGIGTGQYYALLIGNLTSSGSATTDTVVYGPSSSIPMQTEADVIALFGAGSELHRMWRRFRRVNTTTPLYAIASSDSGGTAGSTTVTIATTATAGAVLRVWVGDESVDTAITSGNTASAIGDNVVISVNNMTHWPVTCGNSSGTLTFTSKNKTPRANEIRVRAAILFATGTIGTTVSPSNTSTALTSGATEDSWTTILSTILPTRYYYIVTPSTNVTGTNFDDLVTQVLSQALPATGIRQRVIAGSVDTQANASTVAANSAVNTPRCQITQLYKSEWTAGEIAAQKAAVLALFEGERWAYNFRDFGKGTVGGVETNTFWKIPAPFTQSAWPTPTSIETGLNNGIEPLGVTPTSGGTYETWSTTTKHKNGSNFDYRARSSHIVSVLDRWADELLQASSERLGAKNLISDPKNGEPVPDPNVVYPRIIKNLIFEKLNKYANVYFKDVETIKAAVEVVRDTDNNGRVGWRIPARVIDLLLQNAISVEDNSSAPSP
jgi:phage tail sheath gpL-like